MGLSDAWNYLIGEDPSKSYGGKPTAPQFSSFSDALAGDTHADGAPTLGGALGGDDDRMKRSAAQVQAAGDAAKAQLAAQVSPETKAYMAKKINFALPDQMGPPAPAAMTAPAAAPPAAPAPAAPRAVLKHNQAIGNSAPTVTPAGPTPRDEFKAPVEDPAVVAARAQQANHQANQMRSAQALAGMKANESHVGNLMDRAAQIMTFGDNRMGTMSPNGEENARIPVQDLQAAQAKQRQEGLDADARREALFKQKLQEHVTKTGDLTEAQREKHENQRDAAQQNRWNQEHAEKMSELNILADKAARAGAGNLPPNIPPDEGRKINQGVESVAAAKKAAALQKKVGFSAVPGALGLNVGANRDYKQFLQAHAGDLVPEDQRSSPQALDDVVKNAPSGFQSADSAKRTFNEIGKRNLQNAEDRAEFLSKGRYAPGEIQEMNQKVAQAKAQLAGGGAPHGQTVTQNGHTYVWNATTGQYE